MASFLRLALPAVLLSGCYGNVWEIAINGHVFDETADGALVPAAGEQVELCWDITTHVEPTERRSEALQGCEPLATSAGGSIDTVIYGIGGAYIEDMDVFLYRQDMRIRGSIVSRHVYGVSCPSSYVYAGEEVYLAAYEDDCADDLYETIGYHFIFPTPPARD